MLRELGAWWAKQMSGLRPAALLPNTGRRNALVVIASSNYVDFVLRRRAHETRIGRFPMDEAGIAAAFAALRRRPHRVVLRIPSDALLERLVELPLAAERDLDGVLGYEMNTLTPFAATDVVWQAAILKRDRVQLRLLLQLTLVPLTILRPWLDVLSRTGMRPDCLECAAADRTLRRLALTAPKVCVSGQFTAILPGLVGVLAAMAVTTPFVRQSLALDATERAIAALQPSVAKAETLRKRMADGTARASALAQEQARIGDMLRVLAAVTQILPDDTWLTDLSIRAGKLSLTGESPEAAKLIPALAAEPGLRNPAFAAPVTRAPNGDAEVFVIRADLAP